MIDLLARHFWAHTHKGMEHVPGIDNDPSESIRIDMKDYNINNLPVAKDYVVNQGTGNYVGSNAIGNVVSQNVATNVQNLNPNVQNLGTNTMGTNLTGPQAGLNVVPHTDVVNGKTVTRTIMGTTNVNEQPANIIPRNQQNLGVIPHRDLIGNTNIVGQPGSYPQTAYLNPTVSTEQNLDNKERVPGGVSLRGARRMAYLVILRQFLLNFFSGLAIGAAFATKTYGIGETIAIAVLIYSTFMQMADMVNLYYSGVSYKSCIVWGFIWNLIPFCIGLPMGRGLGTINLRAIAYVFGGCVGGLLYLSTINLMPAILKDKRMFSKALYLISFLLGIGVMYAVYQVWE